MITSAVLASTTLTLIPAIPIFVGAVALVQSIINIIAVKTNINKRAVKFKQLQIEYMKVITMVRLQTGKHLEWDQLAEFCTKINKKIAKIERDPDFVMPLEKYIKLFRLSCCVNKSPIVKKDGDKVCIDFTDKSKIVESESPVANIHTVKVEDEIDDEIETEYITTKPSMFQSLGVQKNNKDSK